MLHAVEHKKQFVEPYTMHTKICFCTHIPTRSFWSICFLSTQDSNCNQPCNAFKLVAAASFLLKLQHNKTCRCSYFEITLKFNKTGNVCVMNTMAHLCNHCSSGEAISITHSECVFLAWSIQHASQMRHILICGLTSSTLFFHIIS